MFVHLPKDPIEKQFKDLRVGEVFIYGSKAWMKIPSVLHLAQTCNATHLGNGQLEIYEDETVVKVADGELDLSYAYIVSS